MQIYLAPKQMAFPGTMHLTCQHLYFIIEEKEKTPPVKVDLSDINYATRELSNKEGECKLVVCGTCLVFDVCMVLSAWMQLSAYTSEGRGLKVVLVFFELLSCCCKRGWPAAKLEKQQS